MLKCSLSVKSCYHVNADILRDCDYNPAEQSYNWVTHGEYPHMFIKKKGGGAPSNVPSVTHGLKS